MTGPGCLPASSAIQSGNCWNVDILCAHRTQDTIPTTSCDAAVHCRLDGFFISFFQSVGQGILDNWRLLYKTVLVQIKWRAVYGCAFIWGGGLSPLSGPPVKSRGGHLLGSSCLLSTTACGLVSVAEAIVRGRTAPYLMMWSLRRLHSEDSEMAKIAASCES